MQLFENLNIDFLGKRRIAYIISGTLIVLGLLSLVLRGLELGIDFLGGTEVALKFENPVRITDVRDEVSGIGLGNVEVKTFGGETGILLRTELQEIPDQLYKQYLAIIEKSIKKHAPNAEYTISDSSSSKSVTFKFNDHATAELLTKKMAQDGFNISLASQDLESTELYARLSVSGWIKENLHELHNDNNFEILKEELVGPKIGKELKWDAIIAVFLSLVVILVYLGFRFKFVFALGAVVALFHDVIITLGLFSLLYGLIPGLNLEISVSVVAAFLTLVGYSINDTVVVFDRVRENIKIHKTAEIKENMNKAINSTMRRTIITSLTTLFVVTVLLFFGGEVLRGFAFTLFFGIIVGTYSSIFVASPFVLEFVRRSKSKVQF